MYCPTEKMLADLYTKPLQGAQFIGHRNTILGINEKDMGLYLKKYENYMDSLKD